jgi:hypothetical protein
LHRPAETRDSGFQNQVSATPIPEIFEAYQCGGLNLLLLPCLPRLQRRYGSITPKDAK